MRLPLIHPTGEIIFRKMEHINVYLFAYVSAIAIYTSLIIFDSMPFFLPAVFTNRYPRSLLKGAL